ncbi:hypothetical protein [Chlamydiifrater phoenicopteri]|uniref:hypothetical protein n=1 Tax=Chlamydiifrater phoenicopteri TaxID=2681469 RepID=UPI001BCF01A6|nr:hypothetical protein [Chlamydiifrater phoenicopteri]
MSLTNSGGADFFSALAAIQRAGKEYQTIEQRLERKLATANLVGRVFFAFLAVSLQLFSGSLIFLGVNAVLLEAVSLGAVFIATVALVMLLIATLGVASVSRYKGSLEKQVEKNQELIKQEIQRVEDLTNEEIERIKEIKLEQKRLERERLEQERLEQERLRQERLREEEARRKEAAERARIDRENKIRDSFLSSPNIKSFAKESITESHLQEKYLNPSLTSEIFSKETSLWFAEAKPEGCLEGEAAVLRRCNRELPFVFLGFLSLQEMEGIKKIYEGELAKGNKNYNAIYANCIKSYPRIVAAEAAYMVWLHEAFNYLRRAGAATFRKSSVYKQSFFSSLCEFLEKAKGGDGRVLCLFEKFSGLVPACMALFQEDSSKGTMFCPREAASWSWDVFSRRVMEYSHYTICYGTSIGNGNDVWDFSSRKTSCSKWKEKFVELKLRNLADTDFITSPKGLWDLKGLSSKDSDLSSKIEEGLRALNECGYLGERSVAELQDLERVILGLKK